MARIESVVNTGYQEEGKDAIALRLATTGIVLNSNRYSRKAQFTRDLLSGLIPVTTARSEVVGEEQYNQFTADTGLVALLKTLEPMELSEEKLKKLFDSSNVQVPIIGATDVMLDHFADNSLWITYNKPSKETSMNQHLEELSGMLTGKDMMAFKAKMGQAVYEPVSRRGVVTVSEDHFVVSPFDREDVFVYLYGMDRAYQQGIDVSKYHVLFNDEEASELLYHGVGEVFRRVNQGLLWEHPILKSHIISVNSSWFDGAEFEFQRKIMLQRLAGCAFEMPKLIHILHSFSKSNCKGNKTDLVNSTLRDYPSLVQDSKWQQIYTRAKQ